MTNPTAQAYAELQLAFDHYNRELFAGELPPCLITMQREKRSYGYFSSERFVHHHDKSKTDEIAINPAYFAVVPLLEVLQTVAHEMVHAWQFHFGNPSRSGYHNREWADKMEAIGLMPSSTGQPGGARTGQKMADYAIPDRFPAIMPTPAIDAGAGAGAAGGHLADVLQPATGNRSNRIKYRCPTCGVQAWGKPALRLLCGGDDCASAPLAPVE